MDRSNATRVVGASLFSLSLSVSVSAFILVQVFPACRAMFGPAFPYAGVYGPAVAFSALTYTQVLEVSGLSSFFGLFIYVYGRNRVLGGRERVRRSLGVALAFFGLLAGAVAYVETHLLWGEFWYGLKFANLDPRGFPWGSEQVAYNTCLVRGSFTVDVSDNCALLNYDQLLLLSILFAVVGVLLARPRVWRALRGLPTE
jgi:hypothetical protein